LGLLLVASLLWANALGKRSPKPDKASAVPVMTARAAVQDVPLSITALGSAQAWRGVTVRAQVSGKLLSVAFREGGDVKAGQLLAQIDPAPFQAVLTQAQGALKRDTALLEAARRDLARYQLLKSQDSIAQQTVETQAAQVKQDEGLVLIDQGQVAAARVNLGYTRITSPITGRVGVRLVDPGNIVSTTDTNGLVTVNEISPIAVTFTIPQGDFQRLMEVSDGFRRPLQTQAISQDTGVLLETGELSIADNHVDPTSGSVQLKARFENASRRLWPGQFVNVKLQLQTLTQALTIPASAVNQSPNGPFAYVVGADGRAQNRPITVHVLEGTMAVVSGVRAGETVVTDGQLSLAPGMEVQVRGGATAGRRRAS
jgi:multidrug efflux system membrane fusion protein